MANALIKSIYGCVDTIAVSDQILARYRGICNSKENSQWTRMAAKKTLPAMFPKKT
jgi:hypothetical protein